ncbi:APC family permease [Frankia sp. R82]|uniref:APC family permease n=1 Tax=Frankia sp. R82 TaxID=2950553 RepID=UPI0020435589|nr:APC family permease [Frankia sp. R82]MCM3886631.1 APC family permease [Frankia sp. R82]
MASHTSVGETPGSRPEQVTPGGKSPDPEGRRGFRRDIGFAGLTFVSLGSIIGSGWLLGALTAAQAAGPAALVSWVLAGILITVLALVHAELGAAYPLAGGTARYSHLVFGPLGGFTAGWMAWLQAVALAPVEVEAALSYLDNRWSGLVQVDGTLTHTGLALAAAAMVMFTTVNLLGVRWLAQTNSVTVVWKFLIPTITVIALMTTRFRTGNLTAGGGFAPFGARGVFTALPAGVVFALQGFEQAVQLGGEARDPRRHLPRAIILATLVGTALYLMLQVAFLGALDPGRIAHGWTHPIGAGDYGPFATLATNLGLGWLAVLLYIDAVISPGGTALIYLGTSSRLSYSLGRTGYLPGGLDILDRRGTPTVSVLLASAVGLLMFLPFPSWQNLVMLISSATFVMYAFAPICLTALRRADPDRPRPYRMPAARLLAPAAFAAADLIVYWAGWRTDQRLFLAILVGLALFGGYQATRPRADRGALEWRAAAWILPWLGGLALFSWLGQFDGRGDIPFWWDIAAVATFSLGVYELAVRCVLPSEQVRRLVDAQLTDAHVEPTATAETAA